jgi:hypothetical protein
MTRGANSASAQRVKRTPINGRNVLTVTGKEPGYVYRVVNDSGDRVQQFLDAGYEKVLANDVQVGDKRINSASPEGSVAQVSVGDGQKAIVMRIREEFYKEDQAAKQAHVNELEKSIKQNLSGADYGSVSITRGTT